MRKEDVRRIEAFEVWIWRRMECYQLDRTHNKYRSAERRNTERNEREKIFDRHN